MFPAEKERIVQLLVDAVDVNTDGLVIRLRMHGPNTLSLTKRMLFARAMPGVVAYQDDVHDLFDVLERIGLTTVPKSL